MTEVSTQIAIYAVVALAVVFNLGVMLLKRSRGAPAKAEDYARLPTWRGDPGPTINRGALTLGRVGWVEPTAEARAWAVNSDRVVTNAWMRLYVLGLLLIVLLGLAGFMAAPAFGFSIDPRMDAHGGTLLVVAIGMAGLGLLIGYLLLRTIADIRRLRTNDKPHVFARNDTLYLFHPLLENLTPDGFAASKSHLQVPLHAVGAVRFVAVLPGRSAQSGRSAMIEIEAGETTHLIKQHTFSSQDQLRLAQLLAAATGESVEVLEARPS